eukprot:5689175-Pleurochrysis_carterae.AAC.1
MCCPSDRCPHSPSRAFHSRAHPEPQCFSRACCLARSPSPVKWASRCLLSQGGSPLQGSYIATMLVDDGLVDCCDGSDELAAHSGADGRKAEGDGRQAEGDGDGVDGGGEGVGEGAAACVGGERRCAEAHAAGVRCAFGQLLASHWRDGQDVETPGGAVNGAVGGDVVGDGVLGDGVVGDG